MALRDRPLPELVTVRTGQSILDWAGVTLAGSQEPAARIAAAAAVDEAPDGPCTLVGHAASTSPQQAALANGIAAHALDFDDGSYWMMGHPSVSAVTAALAVAEASDASGATLLRAVTAGIEAASMVGVLVGKNHYLAGWHATGTIGTFGAAAAAGHVLGVDLDPLRHALGLAATQAAGLKAMNGTMGKPFHAGRAAMSGVLAAQLAARGYTVNDSAIEADQGFAATASTSFRPEAIAEEMGDRFGVDAVSHKVHACCGGTHSTIDAIARLRREHAFTATHVESVRLDVSPLVAGMCIIDVPFTGLEGKFSLRYCAALSLLGRPTGPSAFTDQAVHDPLVLAVVERVRSRPLDRDGPVVDVEIRLGDGRVLTARSNPSEPVDAARVPRIADADLEQHGGALRAKFLDLAAPVVGRDAATRLADGLERLDTVTSVRALAPLLRCRPTEGDEP
jgi:2-methylcitrate dehydratase PrpD